MYADGNKIPSGLGIIIMRQPDGMPMGDYCIIFGFVHNFVPVGARSSRPFFRGLRAHFFAVVAPFIQYQGGMTPVNQGGMTPVNQGGMTPVNRAG